MINLLPTHEKKILKRRYFMRLAIVGLSLVTIMILLGVLSLAPSYLLLTEHSRSLTLEEKLLTSNQTYIENEQLNQVIERTLSDLEVFQSTDSDITISNEVIEPILANRREDISIREISFKMADTPKGSQSIILSGTALTREGLISFIQTLESVPTFTDVAIPIGSFIRQTNISFRATITFDPLTPLAS